jgi:hypothetical protein
MNRKKSIQLKVAFLLIAFSLNVVIGEADIVYHKTNSAKDNCCNDGVMKLQKAERMLASSVNLINPVFFTSFFASFYNIDISSSSNTTAERKYFVRSHHPPIQDIRIGIQSFQI